MFHTQVFLTTPLSNIPSKWPRWTYYPLLLWLLFVSLHSLSVWKCPCERLIYAYYGRYSVYLWCLFLRKLPMCSYYPCLLWILFVSLRSLSVWKCLWVLIIPVYYSRYSVFLPSLFLPNLPNDAFILANAVHICSYWFFKRSFDYARYGMCNLYLITLSYHQGVGSVQSCPLNPRHRLFDEKGCVAAQIQLISLYLCRDTPFPLIFHVSRAGLIPFH